MGLHDRIKGGDEAGQDEQPTALATNQAVGEAPKERPSDPYAELKTRVHHACIAKLGPHLFTTETNETLNDRVLREVTEQLALDRTPLTREERRRIVREITDDILGYGPLEPLLRDDTVTEVMSERVDAPELSAFTRAIIQADQLGTTLGRILRVQAADARLRRQAAAEERAMKAPIKMLFPTVLFIFPAMFLVILGPAILNVQKIFG